jgi:hypothetical protein
MSTNFRYLYESIRDYNRGNIWKDVFLHNWHNFDDAKTSFLKLASQFSNNNLDISNDLFLDLYSLSIVNDLLLFSITPQLNNHVIDSFSLQTLTKDNYIDFYSCIGFDCKAVKDFHPFKRLSRKPKNIHSSNYI